MPYSGIGSYEMKMGDPAKIIHQLTLQSQGETKVNGGNGLNLQTEYTEYKFEIDAEDNITIKA